MSSTKIINVIKDDKLEDLLGIVRDSAAAEVIFVLPKKSRAFNTENDFVILGHEASKGGKAVAFLCSNPDINEMARKYNFDVLSPQKESKKAKPKAVVARTTSPVRNREGTQRASVSYGMSDISDEEKIDHEEHEPDYDKIEKDEDPPFGTQLDDDGETLQDDRTGEEDFLQKFHAVSTIAPVRLKKSNVRFSQKKELAGLAEKLKDKLKDKKFLTVGGAIVIVFIFIVALTSGSAKISISPKSQRLDFQMKITAASAIAAVDTNSNAIPGQAFSVQKSASNTFTASGEKDAIQKARGTLTVYNEYSTSPQPLVATTRFEYAGTAGTSGLVFKTLKTISIPGMKVANGKTVPGSIKVDVIADKAGQTYNVPAGSFGVMAFKEKGDNDRYQKIYAKSDDTMHGGIAGKAKVVSDSDYNMAVQVLTNQVKKDVSDAITSQTAGLEIINASNPAIDSINSTAQIDDAADSFNMKVNSSLKTVGFKKSDLIKVISQYIDKTYSDTILPDKINISYRDLVFNNSQGSLNFTVQVSGNGYAKIDTNKLISDILGKNEAQIKEYIRLVDGIGSAKVILSPFWVSHIPSNKDRVTVDMSF